MAWIWLICLALLRPAVAVDYADNASIQLFQEYIQINTTNGNDFTEAVEFWKKLAAEKGLPFDVFEFDEGHPVMVIKWAGTDPSLGSIMLNSHVDVVPAYEEDGWTYPPFSGYLTDDGQIWGRGTQDMKSVSIQYFEALRRLKADNVSFLRNVYMTLMPDEEVGGESGMRPFLKSTQFAELNVGFALDEGTSFDLPIIPLFYQDKVPWQIQVDCYGVAAHGSTFPDTNHTATGQCRNVINSLLNFRDEEYLKSLQADITNAGVYSSVNLNKINGGTANNVIPSHVTLVFDIRLATILDETVFETQLNKWLEEAGDNITLTYILKDAQSPATLISAANPYWTTIASAASDLGLMVLPIVPPGSTDARFVRGAGFPALGFSPMPNTDLLLHAVDEHVGADTFLKGIVIYERLIKDLANISGERTSADPSVYVYKTTGQNTMTG